MKTGAAASVFLSTETYAILKKNTGKEQIYD